MFGLAAKLYKGNKSKVSNFTQNAQDCFASQKANTSSLFTKSLWITKFLQSCDIQGYIPTGYCIMSRAACMFLVAEVYPTI